jgi:hypothetical protein
VYRCNQPFGSLRVYTSGGFGRFGISRAGGDEDRLLGGGERDRFGVRAVCERPGQLGAEREPTRAAREDRAQRRDAAARRNAAALVDGRPVLAVEVAIRST